MRVLLVDDSAAVRASFGGLVSALPKVELVGSAVDAASALSMVAALAPDLVVLDVELPDGDHGTEVLQQLLRCRPGLQVLVLSNASWPRLHGQCLAAGAAACFDKAEEFRQALDWIAARAATPPAA